MNDENKPNRSEGAPGQNKPIIIYVNGTSENWQGREISFDQVIKLAFENPPYGINTEYQVTYLDAVGNKDGTLAQGQVIKVQNNTKFDVSATDRS